MSPTDAPGDPSHGYEAVAAEFLLRRDLSRIGVATVQRWARSLPAGGAVLDLGCGSGVPISATLADLGLAVYGIDASPTMIDAFRRRLPAAAVACESIENSHLFGRTFDGVVAVGVMFLLSADAQRWLIRRVAAALNPEGRLLFTSPTQACTWVDVLTGLESRSLGAEGYAAVFAEVGLVLVDEYADEGENHYYDARATHRAVAEQ
jgi:2-polyprenyl-3-methyl-5-hydroxy-6-metoxy-1,4-benzoquinol methylase